MYPYKRVHMWGPNSNCLNKLGKGLIQMKNLLLALEFSSTCMHYLAEKKNKSNVFKKNFHAM